MSPPGHREGFHHAEGGQASEWAAGEVGESPCQEVFKGCVGLKGDAWGDSGDVRGDRGTRGVTVGLCGAKRGCMG